MKKSVMLTLSVMIIGLFTLAVPVHAQENATTTAPAGVGILILLMGVAAIGLVALVNIAQGRPITDEDSEDEE
jgi:hypothetical protein